VPVNDDTATFEDAAPAPSVMTGIATSLEVRSEQPAKPADVRSSGSMPNGHVSRSKPMNSVAIAFGSGGFAAYGIHVVWKMARFDPHWMTQAVEETIEELERALGLPQGELVHTVTTFNEHAARGEDPLFHKHADYLRPLQSPPYAALDCSLDGAVFAPFTLGGLDTKSTGEVLTVEGDIVAGLYAAGRNAAGLPRCGSTYASGMSIGCATFFGRRAGRAAAAAAAWT